MKENICTKLRFPSNWKKLGVTSLMVFLCISLFASEPIDFDKAFKEAIELNIPCVIDCHIDREDKVFPMVSPGAAISEAFDREDLNNKK